MDWKVVLFKCEDGRNKNARIGGRSDMTG